MRNKYHIISGQDAVRCSNAGVTIYYRKLGWWVKGEDFIVSDYGGQWSQDNDVRTKIALRLCEVFQV